MLEEGNTKNPLKGLKRNTSPCSTDLMSVKPTQRCIEFSDKALTVLGGNYFASHVGKSFLSEEVSSRTTFDQSNINIAKKTQLVNKSKIILEVLKVYEKEAHPRGVILPEVQMLYCINVVKAFLKAGIPLLNQAHTGLRVPGFLKLILC